MRDFLSNIIVQGIEFFCYLKFFDIFALKKDKKEKNLIIVISTIIIYLLSHFLNRHMRIKVFFIILTICTCMYLIYYISIIKALMLSIMIIGLIGVSDYILSVIFFLTYGNINGFESIQELIGTMLVIMDRLLLFIMIINIKRSYLKNKKNIIDISNKEWLQFLIFPIFTLITVIVMTNSMAASYHEDIVNVYYVIAIGLIVLNMVVFHLINEILENSQRIREADILKQQSIGQLELYNSLRKNYDIQRKRTHEYKNQIMCIDSLLKKKKYDKLEEYINSIFNRLDGQLDMVDTNNEVVNAIINAKYYEALQNDVLFILKINDLSHIKVSDEDIVTILSNLLDNAIEAAGQCEIDKRTVGIRLLYEDDVLSIAVSNSYKTEPEIMEDGYMRTIKDDKEQHGLGIRNVVATLEKYNAEYIIDYKNGEFVFSIIM